MNKRLTFTYDRAGDILHIDKVQPYPEQNSEEVSDDVVARFNPASGEIENLELLFFSARLSSRDVLELPITADLKLVKDA